jgi:hypothetical protein
MDKCFKSTIVGSHSLQFGTMYIGSKDILIEILKFKGLRHFVEHSTKCRPDKIPNLHFFDETKFRIPILQNVESSKSSEHSTNSRTNPTQLGCPFLVTNIPFIEVR